MARIQILEIIEDKIETKNLSDETDIFTICNKKYKNDYSLINIDVVIKDFFTDNGNFYVYDVKINEDEDKVYIKIFNIYIENKNGYHICAKKDNALIISKDIYYGSKFEQMVNEYILQIESEKEFKKSVLQTLSYEVREAEDRVMPKTCQFIEDTLNNTKVEDISKYHVTYEEISEYIKNNRKYIREFIQKNWETYKVFEKIAVICGSVSFAVAMYLIIVDKYGLPLQAATYAYLFNTLVYLSLNLIVERKMDSYVNMDSKKNLVRRK